VLAEKALDGLFIDAMKLKATLVGPPRKVRNASDISLDSGVRVPAELQIIDVRINMWREVAL
jgi:hypothetical protein